MSDKKYESQYIVRYSKESAISFGYMMLFQPDGKTKLMEIPNCSCQSIISKHTFKYPLSSDVLAKIKAN